MKIKINLLYWGTNKDRLANTGLSWFNLKKFTEYAQAHGLEIHPFLFDFSEVRMFDDAIHIPYPNNVYKRSEKINRVIDYHGPLNSDFFAVIDSDVFIDEKDYDAMVYLLKRMKRNEFYVFRVNDIKTTHGIDFENKTIKYDELQYAPRNFDPDLGGLFFLDSQAAYNYHFPESFTVWGGEDNFVARQLQTNGYKKVLLPIVCYHLPHEPELKEKDIQQYHEQVRLLNML